MFRAGYGSRSLARTATERMWKGFTHSSAQTSADAGDSKLLGRTYAIPFGTVWDAAARLADGGLRGWMAPRLDDQDGVLEVQVRGLILRFPADFVIRVSLDENVQTRVDLTARRRHRGGDFGINERRIRRFCTALDRALGAGGPQAVG